MKKISFAHYAAFCYHTKGDVRVQKKKLEELDLLDDFLIFTMVNHPEFGERFSRALLQIIFGKTFGKLKVVPQKVYYGSDTDKHGARLDVYLEEEADSLYENATICDIETEQNDKEQNVKALPRRVRFYHSKIDAGSLKSGADYQELKNVVVIMIMPFDPFGRNHMVYTIKNSCVEVPDLPYDDGAKTLFFYTKGTEGNPTKELQELLHYMEDTTRQNAKNDTLKEIHEMVETVKQNGKVSVEYMRIMKSRRELMDLGREEERENTERERQRAEAAEQRAIEAENKIEEVFREVQEARKRAEEAEARLRHLEGKS